jgi:hypothetical protein
MNIIFGDDVKNISENYTVLELDTIQVSSNNQMITAYCVVETIPLAEFPSVENNKKTHSMMLEQYRKQNWEYCIGAIDILMGAWNGELDTFYSEIRSRIEEFKKNPPPLDWDAVIKR